ncbi:Glycosyltransferase, GT2 family [Hyunsoonleella jejuensis]|uniref:Glycosyltransferase, GT2 family n=1 Tax=Hyunsoonleella jejuensis TaxID=419940 RepID=A0A1H9D8V3_9FLAO|nr:glycosyltransferase family A protein [Hyunsoonleella jejuensis]SEQ09894.1 Glycosyltransferase, GT2 family [Hyunsoonleella jejuensis]
MIIIVHQNKIVVKVLDTNLHVVDNTCIGHTITKSIVTLSKNFSDELIIWCNESYLKNLNIAEFSTIFHHRRILATYNPSEHTFLPKQIGYVERSFVLKINKRVTYSTWFMDSSVGGIYAEVIISLEEHLNFNVDFDYFLNSLAKRAIAEGLFCYSEPKLLLESTKPITNTVQASTYVLFKFVKQHYKWVWVFFLFLSYLIYERKLKVLSLLKALFYKQLCADFDLEQIPVKSNRKVITKKEIDVIIPTIGRKPYLYDVLKDLSNQTLKPKRIIIIEQNPLEGSISELDYLSNEDWPFKIKHIFTHQAGVCNARNIALEHIENDWVFLADDDIRINLDFFEKSFEGITAYGNSIINFACLQPNQSQIYLKIHQTSVFGSGSSMLKNQVLKVLKFNTAYEHGFGEDNDFGMQIRNKGYDVIYFPNIKITHLKAPVGGYRTKMKQPWENEKFQPKPSPTIQLLYQSYFTKAQILGYKLLLGLRSYKNSATKNPFKYIRIYKAQWQQSEYWCHKLKSQN